MMLNKSQSWCNQYYNTIFMISPFRERKFSLALYDNLTGPEAVQLTHSPSKHSVNSVIKLASPNLT